MGGGVKEFKQLEKVLSQLAEEGTVQLFRPVAGSGIILGAAGVFQFDVPVAPSRWQRPSRTTP